VLPLPHPRVLDLGVDEAGAVDDAGAEELCG
jgi:hypothetical protein